MPAARSVRSEEETQMAAKDSRRPDKSSPRADKGPGGAAPALPAMPAITLSPTRLGELQAEYVKRWQGLFQGAGEGQAPALNDKRFADVSWHNNGLFSWNAALYLLNAEFLQRMAASVEADDKTRDRIKFAVQQWVDMLSPANYLMTNPEAQKLLVETQGKSLMTGIENIVGDMKRGRISQTDESAFEVGRNVATSNGAVIYQNELIQLIQYAPTTEKVGARPLLMVPPSINKFYILDLQPDNSMVAYLTGLGHTLFMVSWRNVGPEQGTLTWDDYLQLGVVEPLRVVKEISGEDKINVFGFCVGGTILATALAALKAKGDDSIESLTLLTTLLDFAEPGVLGVFVDEQQVQMREQTIGNGGILAGRDLATTFSFLRPNDLVWNYVVNNYLKGQSPPAFDLLYWNGDSTNLPGPMYCWYLRHMYLQNELRIPGRLSSLGESIDLGRVDVPAYVLAAREDHIVPWRAAYQTTQLLGGPVRFALGASGHIAGAINPASKNKRSYWLGASLPADADEWLAGATEQPGSWWNDWSKWLQPHMGTMKPAPRSLGNKTYKPIEPAPGSYVKQKAA
jgi:polyhydroxyalkanoate synthase